MATVDELSTITNDRRSIQYGFARLLAIGGCVLCAHWVSAQQPPPPLVPRMQPTQVQNDLRLSQEIPQSPNNPAAGSTLRTYSVPSPMIGTVGAHLQLQYHNQPGVNVTTDPATQQLMVMAPPEIQAQISASIDRLLKENPNGQTDHGRAASTRQETTYTLGSLTWRELEDALKRLSGSKMTVTTERDGELAILTLQNQFGVSDLFQIDRRANQVTLIGTRPTVSAWMQVIRSLDTGYTNTQESTHVVPLAPAQPRNIRKMLRLVNTASAQRQDEEEDPFDPDQGQDDPIPNQQLPDADVQNPDEPATAIMGTDDSLDANSGLLGDVQIEIIDDIGAIIVKGSKRDVQRTLQYIEQIKALAKETEPAIEVVRLNHANAEAVATEVNLLYETIYQARQGPVSITALVQPNALLIIGRQEIVSSVKTLVEKLDQPLQPDDQLRVIRLKHASATDLELRIRQFFVQQPGVDQEVRAALGTRVRVVSDYRTNALIVHASPRELVEVEKLVAELDVESSETELEVKVVRLKHAIATELQQVIQAIITGQSTGGGQGGQGGAGQGPIGGGAVGGAQSPATTPSGRLSMVTVGGGKVDSGVLAGVVVSADPSVNALVIKAPPASIPLLQKMIEELDSLPSAEAQVKIFQLKNSDATTVALTLQNLYGLAPTAGQGSQFSLQNNFVNNLGLTAGGENTLVQMRITPEARTNSVIVSGGQADLRVIEAMILRLDEDMADSRRFEVIWLRNATAADAATALTTYFQNYLSTQGQLVQTGVISAQELINRQVLIVPEGATNSLLISANQELFDIALRMIERLDRRPPMVAIQVLIAQIQLDDSLELGAEWGIQDSLLYSRGSATGGTLSSPVFGLGTTLNRPTVAENLAGQALSSLGVGRTSTGGPGGMVLSASSESIGVLMRALQTAGRVQVLNRPQLTTIDSQEATAQVGSKVPRVTGISQAALGTPQQIQTVDADVGLLLTVLPRVNPDGLILMNVGIENSSVGDPAVGIPIGFGTNGEVIRSPIINTTRAATVVSAYSGQTVVFAGLITKERSTQRTQIPVLGSIPWIGAAFRFDIESETRQELLVVLTPRIIQTDEDYEELKHLETSRMSWCLADVLNMHGDAGISGGNGLWGPTRNEVLYPQTSPTQIPDRSQHNLGSSYLPNGQSYQEYPAPQQGSGAMYPSQTMPGSHSPIELQPQQFEGGSPPGVIEASPMNELHLESRRRQQQLYQQAAYQQAVQQTNASQPGAQQLGTYQQAVGPPPSAPVQPTVYTAPR